MISTLLACLIRHLDKSALPKYDGNVSLPGLRDKVRVAWGPYGIPHVFANDETDVFMAQGYLHAQERLWQMDMSRRFLGGQLSEVFGRFSVPWQELTSTFRGFDTVDFDYFMRLIGIRHAAHASLAALTDNDRRRLDAYSRGVNAYIERCGTRLPWEFRLLRYEPALWEPEDCLVILKGFALVFSTALFTRLNMIALAAKLAGEPDKLRALLPSYPADAPTITRGVWDSAEGIWRFVSGTFSATDWNPAGQGSNSWVVGPARSTTGAALLCNDPHLRMTLPPMWYLLHLKAGTDGAHSADYEVWGASIPGIPGIQIGHNRWIAWGVTAAVCDDLELYREKIHRLEPNRYLTEYEWMNMEHRTESIRVRREKDVRKVIRSTCRGPVISDFSVAGGAKEVLSLRWTAHEPSQDVRCLHGVNCARNWTDFLDSLSYQGAPALNYVYADHSGNIGYSLAGKIPIRRHAPSLLPADGWQRNNDWVGYVPFDELPRIYNPSEGAIATANNRIAASSYPYHLSSLFEPPYRIGRIKELLTAQQTHSPEDMAAIHMDVVSLHARSLIGALRRDLGQLGGDPKLEAPAERLLQWNGDCQEDSIASAIFHAFYQRLMRNLLVPALGEEGFTAYVELLNQCLAPVDRIVKDEDRAWFGAEARPALIRRCLREACDELERQLGVDPDGWQWGKIHKLTLSHFLGRVRPLEPILTLGPLPSPGDGTTINLGFYRYSNPYRHGVGPSLRMIVDLGNLQRSRFVLSSGQSGHPFSGHYKDQIELWRRGQSVRLSYEAEEMKNWPRLIMQAENKR